MRGRNLTKILGLSLLAIVAAMAVNASAASANWLLLRDLASVKTLNLVGLILGGEMLVDGLGLQIYCPHGEATGTLLDLDSPSELDGNALALFFDCEVLDFDNVCEVHSPGEANGEIMAEGSGKATMSGTEVTLGASSEEFTEIQFLGPFCPFIELDAPVNGSAHLVILNAPTDSVDKLGHLDDLTLKFGEEDASIHGIDLTPHYLVLPLVTVHIEEASGLKWAIELTNL